MSGNIDAFHIGNKKFLLITRQDNSKRIFKQYELVTNADNLD